MAEKRHPGITMHKITFGGGFIGLLFAAGSALIFVLGLPSLWYFVALAFVLGIAFALVLKFAGGRLSNRNRPLSIIMPAEKSDQAAGEQQEGRKMVRILPGLASV